MGAYRNNKKTNIEIRFFLTPSGARRLIQAWRAEKRSFDPYSFTDFYFTKGKSQAKIRLWKRPRKPTEMIFSCRKNRVKTETRQIVQDAKAAKKQLETEGFRPYLKIAKKRALLVSKKGQRTYMLELVPGIGWTGEMEVPVKDREKIPHYVSYLRSFGATGFTTKSMLRIMEEKLQKR